MLTTSFEYIYKVTLTLVLLLPVSIVTAEIQHDVQHFDAGENNDWVSITGKVSDISGDRFMLKNLGEVVIIEMDDWDEFKEIKLIDIGDRVTVSGRIDAGLFENKTLEAFRVYSHNKKSYYYASSVDDEGYGLTIYSLYYYPVVLSDDTWMSISGTVINIDGREFHIDTGNYQMIIDTDEMSYNPMDTLGFPSVKVGDKLHVTGKIDVDLFEKRELKAVHIEKIYNKSS